MPLTSSGKKVMASMKKEYGDKKGEEVFYATMNKGEKGSEKWHKKSSDHPMEAVKNAMKGK